MPATNAVSLTDVVIPAVYLAYQAEDNPEKSVFVQSGAAVTNPLLQGFLNDGGDTVNIPFWRDLDPTIEPNYSTTDDSSATPQGIATGEMVARKAFPNQAYSAYDLSGDLAGSNPMQRIRNRFGTYWLRQWQRRLIATAQGVLANNIQNDDSDMVHVASVSFDRDAFIEAAFTMGDAVEDVAVIAVHSEILKVMAENDDIAYIRDSDGRLITRRYLEHTVVVDDSLPEIDGRRLSILFGNGAFGYAQGNQTVPVEVERNALQGDGGGLEWIIERPKWILHPAGHSDVGTPDEGRTHSLTRLTQHATWTRVFARKNIPLAFLLTDESVT